MSTRFIEPLVLHAFGKGPNPPKVAIALEMLSLPYTVHAWDYGPDDHSGITGRDYLAINPNGRTPSLQDPNTGVTSWESSACLDYLTRVYDPEGTILGPSSSWTDQQRVNYDIWTSLLISTMGPMTGQLYWFRQKVGTDDDNPKALARYQGQVHRVLNVLESQLVGSHGMSVLDTGFGAVDIHWYCWTNASQYAGVDLNPYPMVRMWYERIKQRKDVQKAYEKIATGKKVGEKG